MAVLTTNPADVLVERLRRQFIPFLRNELRFADYAVAGSQPKGGGSKQLRWMLFNKISQDETGGLTEGSASDGEITTLSVTTITTTVAEYGAWVKISSLADLAHTPETRAQYAEGLAEHGARTLDTLLRNVADNSTTFLVSGETSTGGGTLATTETAMAQDIAVLAGRFNQNDAKPVPGVGMYVCIVHGAVEQDLVTDVTTGRLSWSEVNKYVPGLDGQKKIIEGSPGAIYGVLVQRSNNITTTVLTGTVTAYVNIAIADHAYGRASFDAMTPAGARRGVKGPALMAKQSGPQDTSNPLAMFSTLGWKFNSGQSLLDSNRCIVYYSAQ
jgi:N4-gp56 family major capsid protein